MRIFKRFIVNIIASSILIPNKIRLTLYRVMGIKINAREVRSKCFFNSEFVTIGNESFINYNCQFHSSFSESGKISIGVRCYIGMNVTFCAITHEIGRTEQRAGSNLYYPIKVGNGCWIGANSTILPGVTVGDGCVIAAGSMVIKDCEPNCLYAGNPARKKREL